MADVATEVARLGGLAQKRQLVRRGIYDLQLTAAVRSAQVVRARNGWYSTWDESDPRLRAVRVGGRLTGISAIAAMGGWCFPSEVLHVSVFENAARLRTQVDRFEHPPAPEIAGVRLHWDDRSVRNRGNTVLVSVYDALYRVCCDETLETAVAALGWALRTRAMDSAQYARLIADPPEDRRSIANYVEDDWDSFPEALACTRIRLAGHRVRTQVPLGWSKSIDLVVDDIVGLEIDGREYHADRFEYDRRKDVEVTLAGYHSVRASAAMVFYDWDLVLRGVEAALAQHPALDPAA